jgi:hypothetical protein
MKMEDSTCWLPPSALQSRFEEHLRNKAIPNNLHGRYQKWLRYYLDFCQKYHVPPKHEKSLPPFIQKLQEKQQSKARQEQAVRAITLYYAILKKWAFLTSAAIQAPEDIRKILECLGLPSRPPPDSHALYEQAFF